MPAAGTDDAADMSTGATERIAGSTPWLVAPGPLKASVCAVRPLRLEGDVSDLLPGSVVCGGTGFDVVSLVAPAAGGVETVWVPPQATSNKQMLKKQPGQKGPAKAYGFVPRLPMMHDYNSCKTQTTLPNSRLASSSGVTAVSGKSGLSERNR